MNFKKISRRKFIKATTLSSIGVLLLDSLWFEKYMIDWNYFDISTSEFDKIKIIQISDLHIDKLYSFHKSIARKINSLKPHLIFITGDSVDKTENIALLDSFLMLVDNSIKKFAILGNWEYWGNVNIEFLRKTYSKNNCELLINENRYLQLENRSLNIIGIDDYIGGNADFEKAKENLKPSKNNILLNHCPEYTNTISMLQRETKINLVLSGHTHGGQITFFGFAPITPRGSGPFLKGWYKIRNLPMYISKGIGTSIIPIRIWARAEIVVMNI